MSPRPLVLVELRQVRKSAACCVNSCARHLDRGAVPSPPSFPPSVSPSPSSSFGSQTLLQMKTRRIKSFLKTPRLLPNIHMLSDSCLQPLALVFPSLSGADRGGLQKEPSIPHTKPPSPFKAPATATKTTNYCKTSLITFKSLSVLKLPNKQRTVEKPIERRTRPRLAEFHGSCMMLRLHFWSLFCSVAA